MPPVLFLLGMVALLISLARPTLVLAVPRTGADVDARARRLGLDGRHRPAANASGAATTAARQFIETLPDGARVGVVSFSQGASVVAPLSADKQRAEHALDSA